MYWGEEDFEKYYFDSNHAIYSDKLAKLTIRCNERSGGNVVDRISRVFRHIFVDEVQDLAGYDLDILAALFRSAARVLLVGDPRQVTYLTHHEARNKKYTAGRLVEFLKDSLPKKLKFHVDEEALNTSHRNNAAICTFASRLYPAMKPTSACTCSNCRNLDTDATGIFIVRPSDYDCYMATYQPMQLRDRITSSGIDTRYPAMNFGESKGRGFDRVVIHPTQPMLAWMRNSTYDLKPVARAKFYVALTRARHSVALVADWTDGNLPGGISLFARDR
jgi:DNA helicase II / ATP-dependent DNA helicase PcrA